MTEENSPKKVSRLVSDEIRISCAQSPEQLARRWGKEANKLRGDYEVVWDGDKFSEDGEPYRFTVKQAKLLRYLLERRDKIVPYQDLAEDVYQDPEMKFGTIKKNVQRLADRIDELKAFGKLTAGNQETILE